MLEVPSALECQEEFSRDRLAVEGILAARCRDAYM